MGAKLGAVAKLSEGECSTPTLTLQLDFFCLTYGDPFESLVTFESV